MEIQIVGGDSHLRIEYLKKYSDLQVFIETGTYLGDTIYVALQAGFQKIYSIELNPEFYYPAIDRFKINHNVNILYGDSVDMLPELLEKIGDVPITFWLDAHASGPVPGGKYGGSPILNELKVIARCCEATPTIFIDDRRLFGSGEWDGVKEQEAMDLVYEIDPGYKIHYLDGEVNDDIICATVWENG